MLSCFCHVRLFVTLWTIAGQAPLSMGFFRLKSWNWWPYPPPGHPLSQGWNLRLLHFLHWQTDSLPLAPPGKSNGKDSEYNWGREWVNRLSYSSNGKESPAMKENRVHFLGWEVPLEKGMAIHSSILAWRIPWTQKPGGRQSMGLQRVRRDWATNTHEWSQSTIAKNTKWIKINTKSRSSHFKHFRVHSLSANRIIANG